jgi:pyrroline-5-carboxylate reductase
MKIAIIGCGTMGEAILKGWLNEAIAAKDLLIVQRSIERTNYLRDKYPVEVVGEISAASEADIVMVGVKPQGIKEVLNELGPVLKPGALIISIAVGVTTKYIQSQLGTQNSVVRAMPNTPALVMRGTIGLAACEKCSTEDISIAKDLLSTVGTCVVVDENLIDTVAATSGSGPAYFYWLVETLTNVAIELGLKPEVAELLVRETFIGSAQLMDLSNDSAATLRSRVTSPKGTTQAAIASLEKNEVSKEFLKALQAAIARAQELNEG